jgi:RimJ/RimL family protein N-acetyltransferase
VKVSNAYTISIDPDCKMSRHFVIFLYIKEWGMQKYIIKTNRLGFRFIKTEDIEFLKGLDKDPDVKEFFPEGTLKNAEIKEFIDESILKCEEKHLPCFVIFKFRPVEFIGEAYFDKLRTGEIKVGYLFDKEHWDKGYATETLLTLLDWAKENIETNYIVAYADVKNTASFHVMEKCGMKYYKDGTAHGMKSKFYRIKNQ